MNQPSAAPTRKVASAAIASAVAAIVVWLLQDFAKVQVPPGIEGAFVVIVGAVVGYLVPEADPAQDKPE